MADLRTDLEAWCRSYVAAFEAADANAIAAHWTFPALTTQAGKSFTFKSAEHFEQNTGLLLGFYKAQSVASVERTMVDLLVMGEGAVSMTVQDAILSPM